MKKIVIFLTPILIIAIAFGCSKDNSAPTYSTYDATSSPDNVTASYDRSKDEVNVSWAMEDTSGVYDFFISVSDSSVFDDGKVTNAYTGIKAYEKPYSYTYDTNRYVAADIDSLVLFFTVSAVYKNETFNNFIGPRAEIDTTTVYRK